MHRVRVRGAVTTPRAALDLFDERDRLVRSIFDDILLETAEAQRRWQAAADSITADPAVALQAITDVEIAFRHVILKHTSAILRIADELEAALSVGLPDID